MNLLEIVEKDQRQEIKDSRKEIRDKTISHNENILVLDSDTSMVLHLNNL